MHHPDPQHLKGSSIPDRDIDLTGYNMDQDVDLTEHNISQDFIIDFIDGVDQDIDLTKHDMGQYFLDDFIDGFVDDATVVSDLGSFKKPTIDPDVSLDVSVPEPRPLSQLGEEIPPYTLLHYRRLSTSTCLT